jgi:hypothetical protein
VPDLLVLPPDGPPVTAHAARDLIGDALTIGAPGVVIPVERLDPAFFDLRSGVAGEIVQAFVTYDLRLVVIGDLPPAASSSRAVAGFVREANRGDQTWFVGSMDELRTRLAVKGDMA